MDQSAKVNPPIIKASTIAPNNKVLNQLIQCIQGGNDEVRKYLEDECDVIIECKVCRSLFRGLPNFIAHKRVFCTQRYAEVPNQYQSVFGEAKAMQNEAVIVLCDHSESQNACKATAKSNSEIRTTPNAASDSKTNNTPVSPTEQRNAVPAQSAACNTGTGTARTSGACSSASSASQSKVVESIDKPKSRVAPDWTTSSTTTRSIRERLVNRNDCDLKRLTCLTCDIVYDSIYSLGAHMELRHEQGSRLYPCPTCMHEVTAGIAKKQEVMSFSSVGSTIRHMAACHGMKRDQAQTFKRRIVHLSYVVPEAASDLRLRRKRNREFAARLARGGEQSPIEIMETGEPSRLVKPTECTNASTDAASEPTVTDSLRFDNSEASQSANNVLSTGNTPVNVVMVKQGDRKRRVNANVPLKRVRLEERTQRRPVNNNVDRNNDAQDVKEPKVANNAAESTENAVVQLEQQQQTMRTRSSDTQSPQPHSVDNPAPSKSTRDEADADMEDKVTREKSLQSESKLPSATVPVLASPKQKPNELDRHEVASESSHKPVATPTAASFTSDELSDYASGKGYGCIMCMSSFSRLSALKNHLARSHSLALIEQHETSSANTWFNASLVDLSNDSSNKSKKSRRKRTSKQRSESVDGQNAADDELCDDRSLDDESHGDSKKQRSASALKRDPSGRFLGTELQLPEIPPSKPSVAQPDSGSTPGPAMVMQRRVRTKADLLAFLRTKREPAPSDPLPMANSTQL